MKKFALLFAYFLILGSASTDYSRSLTVLVPSVYCAELKNPISTLQNTAKKSSVPPIEQPKSGHSSRNMDFLLMLILQISAALVGGGLAGALVNILFAKLQSKRELKSLIIAFASELVFAFMRCVLYYEQSKAGKISYSGLFNFADASILSRFAVVNKQPEVVAAIMDLKFHYFQIGRHVEDSSRLATQADRFAEDEEQKKRLMKAAVRAQGTALAFFLGKSYDDIERETLFILQEAKKIAPVKTIEDLEKKFKDATAKKADLDKKESEASSTK
jgi:hypothetical protein